ncbi:TadE family type IV pilus minor pilin [Psychromicrobium sp. YIM B11713]|uniref:TadE family type IV pilus minor pilin n=1 Tax=Psychromicrobium sp. YIM B11713 TaxID=3145233 RepID=UPI00374E7988
MRSASAERGSITAELAVLMPAVTLLFAMIVFGAQLGLLQLRLDDAARAGARQAARGEDSAAVSTAVRTIAGERTMVAISESGGFTTVTVSSPVQGPFSGLIDWRLSAQASARAELATSAVPNQ